MASLHCSSELNKGNFSRKQEEFSKAENVDGYTYVCRDILESLGVSVDSLSLEFGRSCLSEDLKEKIIKKENLMTHIGSCSSSSLTEFQAMDYYTDEIDMLENNQECLMMRSFSLVCIDLYQILTIDGDHPCRVSGRWCRTGGSSPTTTSGAASKASCPASVAASPPRRSPPSPAAAPA